MESAVFKYSDFFDDDGGLKKVKEDFEKLGEELIGEAKKIKKEVSANLNFDDVEAMTKTEAKVEDITKAFQEYGTAKKSIIKIEKEMEDALKSQAKVTDKNTTSVADNATAIEKLQIELEQYKVAVKVTNQLEKQGTVTIEEATIARGRAKEEMKRLSKEIAYQTKLEQAKILIEKNEVKTLQDVRDRMSALRLVVQSLDFEKEADKVKAYNDEINELTDVLSDNSDQFIQNKINIGNYEESIKKALDSSDLFKTNITVIDGALSKFSETLLITSKQAEEMEKALDNNSSALQKFQVSFGKMNGALKASVIGVVIVALAALASMFGSTRKGAVNMEKVTQTLSTTITTFGQVAKAVFVDGFKAWFYAMTFQFGKAKDSAKKAMSEVEKAFLNGADAIVKGLEYIDEAFKIEDQVRALNRELEKTNGVLTMMQAKADDATRSLQTQYFFSQQARKEQEKSFATQKQIAQLQLEAVNNRIRQNAIANNQEADFVRNAGTGLAFAEKVQQLAQQRGSDLAIDNALIEEQSNLMIEIQRIENETAVARYENSKQQRQINQDIFEQNLDLMIDVIDVQKNLSEAFVNDTTKNVKKRIQEFERFLEQFRQNAEDELKEFNILFAKQAKSLGENAPKFDITFDEAGNAKVFLDGVELSIDQTVGKIKELNKQLQNAGIAEIPINRFREFLVELQNGKRDFDALGVSVANLTTKFIEMKNNFAVTKLEDSNLKRISDRIREISQMNLEAMPRRQRLKLIKEMEALEKDKENILKDGDLQRKENRVQAITRELRAVRVQYVNGELVLQRVIQKGSEKEVELHQERANLQREIQEGITEDRVKAIEEENRRVEEAYQRFVENVRTVINLVLDKVLEMQQKLVDQQQEMVTKQGEMVTKQEERAREGLTNTLAFEQKALAQREADLIKSQKKQERLEKIKALWTSYSSYADKEEDPNQALFKALRDFAILESISASFGDGGVVEDRLPSNGIFRGQSHQGNQGGIPILVEGREGIFSAQEMENLGKDNFYKMKDMASMGKVDSNFFSSQRKKFVKASPGRSSSPELIHEMREVKRAIESKPVQNWEVSKIADGVMTLVETTITKNKTTRNHFKTQKPRL
jgi:hypothetical protein